MFVLAPKSPVEMSWLAVIIGVGLAGFAFLCLLAWLDSRDDEDEKEGFADYKPENVEEVPKAEPRKFYTRFQTADVKLRDEPHVIFHNCYYVPIIPPGLEEVRKKHYVSIRTPDGVKITWETDGTVVQEDSTKKLIFWPCPSLSDAIHHKDWNGKPTLFKFNSDGSAAVKAYNNTYYFGPMVEGEPEVGDELEEGHECSNQDDWCYGYKDCYCLEQQYGCECEVCSPSVDQDRDYYDSEDDMYSRCSDCNARHSRRDHDCRY